MAWNVYKYNRRKNRNISVYKLWNVIDVIDALYPHEWENWTPHMFVIRRQKWIGENRRTFEVLKNSAMVKNGMKVNKR